MRAFVAVFALLGRLAAAHRETHRETNQPWPTSGIVSFWYAVDNDWPTALQQIIQPHRPVVTSIMNYCGYEVLDNGTIGGDLGSACAAFFPAVSAAGVRVELVLNAGNCSIDAYRALWADTVDSPAFLLNAALMANATGWNIDLEPQADNCAGSGTGTAADAGLFASWLRAVQAVFAPHNIRLTVAVANWSPVLSQFGVLGAACDRLLDMETYNGDSALQWQGYFDALLQAVPTAQAGPGLGAWSDGKGAWWETPAAAQYKIKQALAAGVPEIAVFRIVPSPQVPQPWPLDFWWESLEAFVNGSRAGVLV